MQVSTPAPDPTLVAQTQEAQAADSAQIQQSLGQQTTNLWNLFGNGSQLSYINIPGGVGLTPAPAKTAATAATQPPNSANVGHGSGDSHSGSGAVGSTSGNLGGMFGNSTSTSATSAGDVSSGDGTGNADGSGSANGTA